jgi:hypothetical protein
MLLKIAVVAQQEQGETPFGQYSWDPHARWLALQV